MIRRRRINRISSSHHKLKPPPSSFPVSVVVDGEPWDADPDDSDVAEDLKCSSIHPVTQSEPVGTVARALIESGMLSFP
jgi:hypothetical protein